MSINDKPPVEPYKSTADFAANNAGFGRRREGNGKKVLLGAAALAIVGISVFAIAGNNSGNALKEADTLIELQNISKLL